MPLVYKFGGASLKDANSIKNVKQILENSQKPMIVVVSAMGKTTKALEALIDNFLKKRDINDQLSTIIKFHHDIIKGLFGNKKDDVINEFNKIVINLFSIFRKNKSKCDDFYYSKIIAYGEIFSSFIVHKYLEYINVKAKLVDIRKIIKTHNSYKDAMVNWETTGKLAKQTFTFTDTGLYITQGFIASDGDNNTTTLGLEGSDFSASVLSYVLDVSKMVVWKDVKGIYSSDPNQFDNVTKLNELSYKEAVELAYFGAKVIHPKTIKPLENKNIPLYVKSFLNPEASGTLITKTTQNKLGVEPYMPLFIAKNNQTLISISPLDFSFISEHSLEHIFSVLNSNNIVVNLMQNSAISFSICVNSDSKKILKTIKELRKNYKVLYNSKLSLITVRHYNDEVIEQITKNKQIFVEQKSRHTARIIVNGIFGL